MDSSAVHIAAIYTAAGGSSQDVSTLGRSQPEDWGQSQEDDEDDRTTTMVAVMQEGEDDHYDVCGAGVGVGEGNEEDNLFYYPPTPFAEGGRITTRFQRQSVTPGEQDSDDDLTIGDDTYKLY